MLRPLGPDDHAEFCRVHRVSADLYRPWLPAWTGTLDDLFRHEMARAEASPEDARNLRLVGVLPDGRFAGFFGLGEIARGVFQNAYASWTVNAEVARQGYATEGVQALLDVAFSPRPGLGLHRVQANVIPENERSVRLAERVGLRREGLARRYLQVAGTWRDHLMFAKTAEEHAFTWL